MMEKLCNTNKISIVLAISSILFFLYSFDYSYSINNENNEIKDEEFDYIFDPGEYIGSEKKEQVEEDANSNKLNNQNNLAEQSNDYSKIINTKEDINLVNKSNNENNISQTYMDENNDNSEDNFSNKEKVVVKTRINLANLEKKGFLTMAAFINGQEVLKNVSLDELDPSKRTLIVNLVVDKETDIVNAGDRDEFFVCAYHIKDLLKEYNSLTYFDCDEGDLLAPDKPTISRLFSANSLVYLESQNIFNNSSNKYSQLLSTNNDNDNPNQQKVRDKEEEKEQVKIKIYVPLEDRKNTQKLKIAAMVKGQIKSAVIDNVQEELSKIGGYTISRTFTFDRDTNIGKIQIGDRYHACVSGNDLNPPEGSECEKRTVKNIGRENVLYAR
ncbi:MAG TPA: hypothetical protein VFR65_11850 [Nitrososphaeraceae archaeon]|nr:hypothetical protein [Nitrososphaeraceae archaeon]